MAQFPQSYSDIIARNNRKRKPLFACFIVVSIIIAGLGGYVLLTRNSQPHITVSKVENLQDLEQLSNDVNKINDSIKQINLQK